MHGGQETRGPVTVRCLCELETGELFKNLRARDLECGGLKG